MARKIAVIEASTQTVDRHVKRVIAQLLVRRMLAYWEDAHTIRMVGCEPRTIPSLRYDPAQGPSDYIPERLPAMELPGIKFHEPTSPTWQRQHRGGGSWTQDLHA